MLTTVSLLVGAKSVTDITNDLVAKALSGDRDARLTIASILNDPEHPLHFPAKAVDIYKSMAENGDAAAFTPLAEHYSDPLSPSYAPHRAMFYYKRLQTSPHKLALLSFLSHKVALEPYQTPVLHDDPYQQLLTVFSYFPFEQASNAQREMLAASLQLVEAKPFLAYLLPPFALPVVAETHLFELARTVRDNMPVNELRWQYDQSSDIYIPLIQSQGVAFVKFFFDKPSSSNGRLTDITLAYPLEAHAQLASYYKKLLPHVEKDTFYGEGIRATIRRTNQYALLEITFADVPSLLLPAQQSVDSFQQPKLIYTNQR